MDDESGIMIFLGVSVLVIAGIVVFGLLSSRRKKRATTGTFTVRMASIIDQPFLESNDLDASDKRQEELFRLTYPTGGSLPLKYANADGQLVEQEVHVSRIGRSLRSGFPQAKLGLSVYFREWENSEFPATFSVMGSDKMARIVLDAAGARAVDAGGADVWSAPWAAVSFSNGSDILLSDGMGNTARFDRPAGRPELEEILIKYGTLKQMHF